MQPVEEIIKTITIMIAAVLRYKWTYYVIKSNMDDVHACQYVRTCVAFAWVYFVGQRVHAWLRHSADKQIAVKVNSVTLRGQINKACLVVNVKLECLICLLDDLDVVPAVVSHVLHDLVEARSDAGVSDEEERAVVQLQRHVVAVDAVSVQQQAVPVRRLQNVYK